MTMKVTIAMIMIALIDNNNKNYNENDNDNQTSLQAIVDTWSKTSPKLLSGLHKSN